MTILDEELLRVNAQDPGMEQVHASPNLHKSSNTVHLITGGFDKPASVRLKSRSTHSSTPTIYKCHPIKGSCKLNVYNVFSKDHTSGELRSDYEIWNYGNSQEPRSNRVQRLIRQNEINAKAKARYTKLIDRREKPYVIDDDYSLMNYVDDWKGVDRKVKRFQSSLPKSGKILKTRKHHEKRDLEDKEFQVEFRSSRKGNEFKGNLQSYVSANECHRKMFKSHYRPKQHRSYCYLDGVDHYKSRAKFTSNKKHTLWGRKRGKVYPKLGANSGFLDELEGRPRSSAGKGQVWHWATTRDYVAAITPRKEFVTPHDQEMGMLPRAFIPVLNPSGGFIPQSFTAKIDFPQSRPEDLQTFKKLVPLPIAKNGLPFGSVGFQPVLSRNLAQSRSPSIFFNPSTEIINPYENHYEQFKNTPFWNARAGPPQFGGVLSNPVRLYNAQRFKMVPNGMPDVLGNIGSNIGEERFKNGSSINRKVEVSPLAKNSSQGTIPARQSLKVLETADIVNLLQNAFIPQIATDRSRFVTSTEETSHALLRQSIPIDQVLDIISPSGSTWKQFNADNAEDPATDKKLMVDATKQALLSLFTTEGPMMESLEDILRRNTDRKIPIVYDIEDAPQLALRKANDNSKNISQQEEALTAIHVLNRRGILKKNKSATKSKIVAKADTTNNTRTTPWIVLATTENMLYSEIMEMERRKLNSTRKSKILNSAARSKINLRFKNKSRSNVKTDEIQQQEQPTEIQQVAQYTEEPKVKNKRDEKAATARRKTVSEPVTFEPRCGKCTCNCHPTARTTRCCGCKERPPLELTTKVSCQPANLSKGSISCPDCHQEFTYKLALRRLDV